MLWKNIINFYRVLALFQAAASVESRKLGIYYHFTYLFPSFQIIYAFSSIFSPPHILSFSSYRVRPSFRYLISVFDKHNYLIAMENRKNAITEW